jgi:hypothetical protein
MGLCTWCGKEPPPGRRLCERCGAKLRENRNRVIAERRTAGLCVMCGKPSQGFALCKKHKKAAKAKREAKKAARKASGQCMQCERAALPGQTLCAEHARVNLAKTHAYRKRKAEMCAAPYCRLPPMIDGYCPEHIYKHQAGLCSVPNCIRPIMTRDRCDKHQLQNGRYKRRPKSR